MACQPPGGSHRDLSLWPRHVRLPALRTARRPVCAPRPRFRPGPSGQRTAAGRPPAARRARGLPVTSAPGPRSGRPLPSPGAGRGTLSPSGSILMAHRTYRAPGAVRTVRDSHEPHRERPRPPGVTAPGLAAEEERGAGRPSLRCHPREKPRHRQGQAGSHPPAASGPVALRPHPQLGAGRRARMSITTPPATSKDPPPSRTKARPARPRRNKMAPGRGGLGPQNSPAVRPARATSNGRDAVARALPPSRAGPLIGSSRCLSQPAASRLTQPRRRPRLHPAPTALRGGSPGAGNPLREARPPRAFGRAHPDWAGPGATPAASPPAAHSRADAQTTTTESRCGRRLERPLPGLPDLAVADSGKWN